MKLFYHSCIENTVGFFINLWKHQLIVCSIFPSLTSSAKGAIKRKDKDLFIKLLKLQYNKTKIVNMKIQLSINIRYNIMLHLCKISSWTICCLYYIATWVCKEWRSRLSADWIICLFLVLWVHKGVGSWIGLFSYKPLYLQMNTCTI